MRLALVSSLAALVVAPLAAQAAQPPTRWAVTLTGRVTESYSYSRVLREPECVISRMGSAKRELVVRSVRATTISVREAGTRVVYRPSAVARVSVRTVPGQGWWSELRRCRGNQLEKRSGTCPARPPSSRVVSASFRRWGTNRIAFLPRPARPVDLCGAGRSVTPDAWLHVAPGRADEVALARGSRLRVTARAATTRDGNIVEEPEFTVGENLRVAWTLRFRRLG